MKFGKIFIFKLIHVAFDVDDIIINSGSKFKKQIGLLPLPIYFGEDGIKQYSTGV
jgi:hypothetical protein